MVNVAEARASVEAIEFWKAMKFQPCPLLLRGDSQIMIDFLTRCYKTDKRELVVAVDKHHKWGREWARVGGVIKYQHVPRALNSWADWLARVAAS